MRGTVAFVGALVLVAFGAWHGASLAADPPAKGVGKELPSLAAALKESPGCLGVEVARTASGKSVIFAWFEDKKAALAWYNSDTHRVTVHGSSLPISAQIFPRISGCGAVSAQLVSAEGDLLI